MYLEGWGEEWQNEGMEDTEADSGRVRIGLWDSVRLLLRRL